MIGIISSLLKKLWGEIMSVVIDGTELCSTIQDTIKADIKNCMIRPSVAVIQVGDSISGQYFSSKKEKVCSSVGIYFRSYKFEDGTPELTIINKIKELNNDEYVNGIIIELPLPVQYNEKRIINTISNGKDVEGMTDINVGRFINGKKALIPCTALAVDYILSQNNIQVAGKNVVVVGRGKATGRPIANMLLSRDATVTICHSKTKSLAEYTKNADILISATGIPCIIKEDMVKEGAVVIDVGISGFNDSVVGDVDFDKVSKKASYITTVENGVNTVALAMLLQNIILCYNTKKNK